MSVTTAAPRLTVKPLVWQFTRMDRITSNAQQAGLFIPVVLSPLARLCAEPHLFDTFLAACRAGNRNGGGDAVRFTAHGIAYVMTIDTEHRKPLLYIDLAETA